MVREWLDRDELQDELFDILDAIGKGISLTEIVWDTSEGQWRPERLEWRDPRWFRFDREDGRTPLLRTDEGDAAARPASSSSHLTIRAKSGLPVRSGIARLAAWAWMFKAFTQRDWAIFTQTYGQPIRVGKYSAGATEEQKDTLFRAVANIAGDCAAIIPDAMLIEFIEAEEHRRTSRPLREARRLARPAGLEGGARPDRDHRRDRRRPRGRPRAPPGAGGHRDAPTPRRSPAVLNRDLVRPWIDLEFGPQEAYPRLRIARPDEEDLEQLADSLDASWCRSACGSRRARSATSSGCPIRRTGRSCSRRLDKSCDGDRSAGDPTRRPASRRCRRHRRRSRRQTSSTSSPTQAETLAGAAGDALVDTIRELVPRADSLEEVRDGLAALKPDMPAEAFARAMQTALAYAELTGRAEIADGSSDRSSTDRDRASGLIPRGTSLPSPASVAHRD